MDMDLDMGMGMGMGIFHVAVFLAPPRVRGYIGACHKQRLHEFDLETTLSDLRRSLQDAARPM